MYVLARIYPNSHFIYLSDNWNGPYSTSIEQAKKFPSIKEAHLYKEKMCENLAKVYHMNEILLMNVLDT